MLVLHTLTMALLLAAGPDASRLAVIRAAPDFTLPDQAGRPVSKEALRGKVWLVSFVFTTCTGSCPETTLRMSLIQRELQKRGLIRPCQVRLLSITLDPERDRPEVLRDYMQAYRADPAVWSFLTGPPEQVRKVIAGWGMWAKRTPDGQLDHPSRIFLVDRQGRIREIYNLSFLRPTWVAEDIALLLREGAEKK
jgi:protein SCO1/2